jgi:hypothetical protein
MPFSPKPFAPVDVNCPFLDQPCPQGALQGFECQLRVLQKGEIVHFRNDAVVYCSLCQREISASAIPRFEVRPDKA